MKEVNLLLIGSGPHSKRIYYPAIESFSFMNINLIGIVDIEEKKNDINEYLKTKKNNPHKIFVKKYQQTYEDLHPAVELKMNKLVEDYNINGVIIATEPLVHVMYAKWALKNNLSILMDKPISSHIDVSVNINYAKKLITDYNLLNYLYNEACKRNRNIIFSLMAQRRYQTSFNLMKSYIEDCFKKTNCPITNVQTFHSDGQWRMPSEIVDQLYHPYMQGYGKCSHSGYHYYDIIPFLLDAGLDHNKYYDNIDVYTTFSRPLDFLEQLSFEDYKKLFGIEEFEKYNKYSEDELNLLMKNYGEIDTFSNIAFKKGNRVMTLASINLAHNGVAERNWITADGKDLYRGNGRVGHECHILQQGPFQTIHFHSYKSPSDKTNSSLIGGKKHIEIYVFKNHKMLGGKRVEKFVLDDLLQIEGGDIGFAGKAKSKAFLEFIRCIKGEIPKSKMISEFKSQLPAVILTSAIYQSACAQRNNLNPLINLPIDLGKKRVKVQKNISFPISKYEKINNVI